MVLKKNQVRSRCDQQLAHDCAPFVSKHAVLLGLQVADLAQRAAHTRVRQRLVLTAASHQTFRIYLLEGQLWK